MFDEVSVRGNLHFNKKFGCIEGYEDLGNQDKARNVAAIFDPPHLLKCILVCLFPKHNVANVK